MPDQPRHPAPRSLSEISHLFLSSVRENQSKGMPRPMRTPPAAQQFPRSEMSVDLTPEELAQVFGDEADLESPAAAEAEQSGPSVGPVRAVLASHLGTQQLSRVQAYASSLCGQGQRIGLIAIDASEFRLSIFEHNPHPLPPAPREQESEVFEPRKMTEALEELAWDVDRWLLLLPSPRSPEARLLLRDVPEWTALSTCDHDGVVACYRTIKGLSDLSRPRLCLATLDATDDGQTSQAFGRLSSVCRQFLDWTLENESPVLPTADVTEHVVLWCCATRDKAQLATAPQWQVVADFLRRAKECRATPTRAADKPLPVAQDKPAQQPADGEARIAISTSNAPASDGDIPEVIDLPDGRENPAAIVAAVLHGGNDLVQCPVRPPMCPDASLAVSRDHRLVLVAVARQGLSDLRQIGRAYQWLMENRPLIGMAVPQMAIDAHQLPRLKLLVDHADMSAQLLQPLLQTSSVSVHAYRKLRWAGKTGLLLEAA